MAYTFTTIVDASRPSLTVVPHAINDSGTIAGSYNDQGGSGQGGFVDDNGTFTTINVPNAGFTTQVWGINNSGVLVGTYTDSSGHEHGFVDDEGAYTTIDVPNSGLTVAEGINNSGEIVGIYYDNQGEHGFLDNNGSFTTINASADYPYTGALGINDSSEIAGITSGPGGIGEQGFLDNNGNFTTVRPPATGYYASANGINNLGEVVGWYDDSADNRHGYIYNKGNYNTLDVPGAISTVATGINGAGEIVGYYSTGGGLIGFVARPPGQTITEGNGNHTITLTGSNNTVTVGNGNNTITGAVSDNTITTGNGKASIALSGGNNAITRGNGDSTISVGGSGNKITLGNGTATVNGGTSDTINITSTTLTLTGIKETVFLSPSSATVKDFSTDLTLQIGPTAGQDILTNFASDPGGVVDLIGGIGGFTNVSQVLSALTSDGKGGTLLSFGHSSSLDFTGTAPSQLHANFQIG